MSNQVWDEQRVQAYIDRQIEESFNLEYKAAAKLTKSNSRTDDVTKVVSAMANSAGGIVIFGIAENQTHKHLPERMDPVDRNVCPREHLEQIINNIQPKLDAYCIHSVQIGDSVDRVVYVVDVPQSHTAHQATDKKYYRRHGSISEPMADYEIRDVMGRRQHPRVRVDMEATSTRVRRSSGLIGETSPRVSADTEFTLHVTASNTSPIYAEYVHVRLEIPSLLVYNELSHLQGIPVWTGQESLDEYDEYVFRNTHRDLLRWEALGGHQYGPARYVPLLAGDEFEVGDLALENEVIHIDWGDRAIRWEVQADNAPAQRGEYPIIKLLAEISALQ
jgi:hypothetical protein